MSVQLSVRVSLSLSLAHHPKKISKHAPQKNQKAFAYGTEAGSGSHLANQEASGAGKAFAYGTGAGGRSHLAKLRDGARHCVELYTALRDGARHCKSALSLSFLLRILSGAAKAPWRPAPERIRSKNERLSAQSFTRRYEMVRDTVTDRAPRAFKEQASTRIKTSGASEPRKGRPQRASEPNTKPGWCARCVFSCARRGSLRNLVGPPELARCAFIDIDKSELGA